MASNSELDKWYQDLLKEGRRAYDKGPVPYGELSDDARDRAHVRNLPLRRGRTGNLGA